MVSGGFSPCRKEAGHGGVAVEGHQGDDCGGGMFQVKPIPSAGQIWLVSLLVCALVVATAFSHLDVEIARRAYGILGQFRGLATGLGSAVLLALEATVVLALVITRILRGHLSPFREAMALACLTSMCSYAINTSALKVFFGVLGPVEVLQGARHMFNFLHGDLNSSFPSGHMVLAGAFAGVFMRLYRASVLPLAALLLIAATLLIMGDWHFLSDVVAGAFLGISAGLLAGELWITHSSWDGAQSH